ncbi:MAG TPA: FkbM family methyltransferase [Acidimicrobiales bacterium]|nr:FkbM family methyltransferase [Acidimicrobiales bacterium]
MEFRTNAVLVLRRLLNRLGFDLVRSLDEDDLLRRRLQLLKSRGVNVVFDVGAHAGQYGQTMRAAGYDGRLVSFEPLPEPFAILESASSTDGDWEVVNVALGDGEKEVVMHVAGNSQSSSVLQMLPAHQDADARSRYVGECRVPMTTLEKVVSERVGADDRLFVKVDAQGYEEQVLAGAGDELARITGLQLELSLVHLYEGQALLHQMVSRLMDEGFVLVSIEPGFWDRRTGQLLQADGIFFRL